MTDPEEQWVESGTEIERTVFFSDAVFAITLLALNIEVPEIPHDLVATELPGRLLDLWPQFLSYVLSFLIIGFYWMAHHRTFHYIRSYDHRLLLINLLVLMLSALVPFSSSLLGEYGDQQIAVVFYATHLAVTGLALSWLWWYASRNPRLIDPDIDPRVVRYNDLRGLLVPLFFVLSIGISFVSVTAAQLSWVLIATVLRPILLRYIRRYRSA